MGDNLSSKLKSSVAALLIAVGVFANATGGFCSPPPPLPAPPVETAPQRDAPGEPLTLRGAVGETITQHPTALSAREAAEAAVATARGAGNQPNPQIGVPVYVDGSFPLNTLFQTLEVFGQPGFRSRAAWGDARASILNAAATTRSLSRVTVRAYYDFWTQRRTIWIRERYLQVLGDLQAVMDERAANDPAVAPGIARLHLEQALGRADLVTAQADAESAQAILNAALGRANNNVIVVPNDPPAEPTPSHAGWVPNAAAAQAPLAGFDYAPSVDPMLAMSEQRPELLSAQQSAYAAHQSYQLTMRNRAPTLQLQAFAHPIDVHQVTPVSGRTVGVVANFPLLDWGELGAARKRALHTAKSADLTVSSRRLDVRADVNTAYQSWSGAVKRRENLQTEVQQRFTVVVDLLERLRAGTVSLDDAINTSKSLRDVVLENIRAGAAVEQTKVDLWYAAGGALLPPAEPATPATPAVPSPPTPSSR